MAERDIVVLNSKTGQKSFMNGTLRHSVLQAYAQYELNDLMTGDLNKAYGHLVTEDGPDRARLGDWVAVFLN